MSTMTTAPETTATQEQVCGWRCGDTRPDHKHYAVLCYENGKQIGRLTPQGGVTTRKIFASIFSEARATAIAAEITADDSPFTAKAIKF